ncbi:peroxidase-like isoform X2 [Centruroides vittatus]
MKKDYFYGRDKLNEKYELEEELTKKDIRLKNGSPAHFHQIFLKSTERAREIANCAVIAENAQKKLKKRDETSGVKYGCMQNTSTYCNSKQPYREIDGRCNNLKNPDWGSSYTAFIRLLDPDYSDKISAPRKSRSGKDLPSARLISNSLYTRKSQVGSRCTLMTMLWGLFVDHDVTNTAVSQDRSGLPITCCHKDILSNNSLCHPECYPIKVPKDDKFYSQYNVTCMEFVRASPVKTPYSVYRQQLNQITSYLDGSAIYGSTDQELSNLRSFYSGRLKVSDIHKTEVLPKIYDKNSFCGLPKEKLFCFQAGDRRANEHVELTVIHTIWMREHNRLAEALENLNPDWDDETLFQEARKLVIAELQHITYNEYLPLLFGVENINKYNLKLLSDGYFDGYNASSDATASNVFASAAFRFGHSQVQSYVQLYSSKGDEKKLPLHDTFFNPTVFYTEGLDDVIRGATKQRSKIVWSQISDEVRNRLFQSHYSHYGMDLSSISIQRSRDHGIPSYNKWREYCGFSKITSWEQLEDALDEENAKRLKKLYESVDDVDLIPAALSERKSENAGILGPTHSCLIAEQFARMRIGDRFWYENKDVFSPDQLREIRKVTLSRVLCDNSDNLLTIQKWALHPESKKNPIVHCANSTDIPEINFQPWSS